LGQQSLGLTKSNSEIQPVDWVKGGLLMIRKEVFDKLHGFDEKIFMYIEDMELCYRAKQHGFTTYFYPDVQIAHKEHGSANRTFAIVHIYKGILYFYKKHRSGFEYACIKSLLLTKAILAIMIGSLLRKPYLVETYKKAIIDCVYSALSQNATG
jgi:GT2 family glycosyltransferase